MAAFRVLHLSDIHIGNTYIPSDELAYKIANDIAQNGSKGIRCVLVTGDIFNGPSGGSPELVSEAVDFFRTLLQQINYDQPELLLTPEDFVFIPGNHDLLWKDELDARWKKYRDFLSSFYGKIPDFYDLTDFTVMRTYEVEKIVFLGFNSCGLDKSRPYSEARTICEAIPVADYRRKSINKDVLLAILDDANKEQFDDYGEISARQFANQRRRMKGLDGYTSVALFHHHFYLFPDIAGKVGDADVVRNHTALVQYLRSLNVKTILHGHKHFDLERPFVNEDYYETTDSIIDVFAGGSAGAGGMQHHTFSVLDFYSKAENIRIKQRKFIYEGDLLKPISEKQIPPQSRAPQIIKLLELLETNMPDAYHDYLDAAMSNQRLYLICNTIISWIGEALTGFPEVCRSLTDDPVNLLFLLFSIHSRTLDFLVRHAPAERVKFDACAEKFNFLYSRYLDGHVPTDYISIFQAPKLQDAAKRCDVLLEQTPERAEKQYLSFSMVGLFFSDLYLVMTEYADDFYKQISYKVNIKLEPNHFHTSVPAARIVLSSDADRRSAYVSLFCNDATSHKLAVLFVKEFDLTVSKYEDYFKLIGLKLYYLLPKIDKDPQLDALDNYNFEAYIPTLLPLLTGDNIYHSKEVFARELIQNSIDAISVREAIEGPLNDENRTIYIELGKDGDGRRYFQITDHGTGMDRYKIERYFTSIGRSFYSGEDYAELGIGYKPISNFGIGFLSSFMVCQEIDVQTRSFEGDREGLKLHIPNYEGCFFIERDQNAATGTRIRLYLTNVTDDEKIIEYIKSVMRDINYPIQIARPETRTKTIPAHSARKNAKDQNYLFFVPFYEDGSVGSLEWHPRLDTMAHSYGLAISAVKGKNPTQGHGTQQTLNAGILVGDYLMSNPFFDEGSDNPLLLLQDQFPTWNNITVNFPANWIQMDVSREKVVGFSPWLNSKFGEKKPQSVMCGKIAESLKRQVSDYLNYVSKHDDSNLAVAVQELYSFILQYAKRSSLSSTTMVAWAQSQLYCVDVIMGQDAAEFRLLHSADGAGKIEFSNEKKKDLIPRLKNLIYPKMNLKSTLFTSEKIETLEEKEYRFITPDRVYWSPSYRLYNSYDTMNWSKAEFGKMAVLHLLSLYNNSRMLPKKSDREQFQDLVCRELLCRFSVAQVEQGDACLIVPYDTLISANNK